MLNSDQDGDREQEIQIKILARPMDRNRIEKIMDRITQYIEETYCGPDFADDDDHECPLYAMSWHVEDLGEDGLTASERELEAYKEAWVERFGPLDRLTLERFGVIDWSDRYEKNRK